MAKLVDATDLIGLSLGMETYQSLWFFFCLHVLFRCSCDLACCLLFCNFLDISCCILCMMYQFSFVHLSMKILWCFCKLISMCYCSLLLFLNFFCVVCSCIPFISLLIIVEQRKSNEAEVESLREEYHQRVATLERKVSLFVNLIFFYA